MAHKGKKKHKDDGVAAESSEPIAPQEQEQEQEPTGRHATRRSEPLGIFGALSQIALGTSRGGDRSDNPVDVVSNALSDVAQVLRDHTGKITGVAESSGAKIPGVPDIPGIPGVPAPLDAVSGSALRPVVDMLGEGVRTVSRVAGGPLLGVAEAVGNVMGASGSAESSTALRKRGNALIRISYKPEYQRRDMHPSFLRIIDELLPDEARILRFLSVAGPQPVIDVRTKTLFQIGSVLLVSNISMVAQMAGCYWPDRDQHYFANLHRLGLVNISNEPVDDYRRYALLEVQPPAIHAIESVPKAVTVFRSLLLTPFGEQFNDVCFDTEGYHAGGWDTDGRQDKTIGKGPPELRVAKTS